MSTRPIEFTIDILNQSSPATAASDSVDVAKIDGASFHIIWDGALTASFTLQTSNDGTNWYNENDVTISGAAGYASNVLVHLGNFQSHYARIFSNVATPAGTLLIKAHGRQ